jgi:hypothetical protein
MQTRQDMGPGDYWQDRDPRPSMFPFGPLVPQRDGSVKRVPFHTLVEVDEGNRNDRRLACTQCDMATAWSKGGLGELEAEWSRLCEGSRAMQP